MTINVGELLLESIESKDAQKSLAEIQQYKEYMRDPLVGAEYVKWITEPVNLTSVHKALAEDLNIPPRLLAIRRMSLNRTQKAVLIVQAMELAVKRVHNL